LKSNGVTFFEILDSFNFSGIYRQVFCAGSQKPKMAQKDTGEKHPEPRHNYIATIPENC
jgi:hypothetical protein